MEAKTKKVLSWIACAILGICSLVSGVSAVYCTPEAAKFTAAADDTPEQIAKNVEHMQHVSGQLTSHARIATFAGFMFVGLFVVSFQGMYLKTETKSRQQSSPPEATDAVHQTMVHLMTHGRPVIIVLSLMALGTTSVLCPMAWCLGAVSALSLVGSYGSVQYALIVE